MTRKTEIEEALDKYTDNKANYLEYSDDGWEDKTDLEYVDRAFKAGAQWADEHPDNLWKDACGTDLPEIDREVIALLTNGKVVFAHRHPERWYGRGEENVLYPTTYDEGEWNQPDVKWWLDIELPQMEE